MKKLAVILLSLALLLSFAGCGKNETDGADEKSSKKKTAETTEEETQPDVQPPADAVITQLDGYTIAVQPMDHERESETTYDGLNVDAQYSYGTDEVRLNVAVQDKTSGNTEFDIFIRCAFPSAYIQEGNPVLATLKARFGSKWLFGVRGSLGEDEDIYIYDAEAKVLTPLDSASTVLFYGERVLTHAMAYSEEGATTARLWDWNGGAVNEYSDVFDLTESGGKLYLLRYYEPVELYAVSTAALADPNGSTMLDLVCELGPYNGAFYENDSLVLQPYAGGYPVTCKLTEAAETVASLMENAPDAEGITESCDVFSLTLPGDWEDRYICVSDDDSLTIRYKESPYDNEGIFLFMVLVSDGPDSLEEPGFGGAGVDYEVCMVKDGDATRYIMVSEPDELYGVPEENTDDYLDMLSFTENITDHLQGENGYELEMFDYEDLVGVYIGYDSTGAEYRLAIDDCRYNILYGSLYYENDEMADSIDDVTVRMFANGGALDWFVDLGDDDWAFGSGVFLQEEEGFSMMLSAQGDAWTTTDGYLSMDFIP